MQETRVEDVANHNDPESCGEYREVRAHALTWRNASQPLSCEIYLPGADRVVLHGEALLAAASSRWRRQSLRSLRSWHVWTFLAREPSDLHKQPAALRQRGPQGRTMAATPRTEEGRAKAEGNSKHKIVDGIRCPITTSIECSECDEGVFSPSLNEGAVCGYFVRRI